jgi:hypothetical protein
MHAALLWKHISGNGHMKTKKKMGNITAIGCKE